MLRSFIRIATGLMAIAMLFTSIPASAATSATDFTLRDLDGKSISLSAYKGQVVVLSFWATWCGPCKEEMPHLQAMYDDFKDQGFVVLSVSTDNAREASRVKQYIRTARYTFPVVLDRESSVIGTYNPAKTMPFTVVIGRDFQVAKVHSGYNPGDEKELRVLVETLLGGGEAVPEVENAEIEVPG